MDLSKVKNVQWFPGHMSQGLKVMERRLKSATCLVELRDARLPITSANPLLSSLVKRTNIRHFIAYNKVDLCLSDPLKQVMNHLRHRHGTQSMALRASSKQDCRRLIRSLINFLQQSSDVDPEVPLKIMIAGIPNVGKSTLINSIRSISCSTDIKAAKTGKNPGVTRVVSEQIKISDDPKVYLWDTPGILVPRIDNAAQGMRLAAIGSILDKQIGEFLIAEYLLEVLKNSSRLTKHLKTDCVPDDFNTFLDLYARRLGMMQKKGELNIVNACRSFLSRFRDGYFGKVCLEDVDSTE